MKGPREKEKEETTNKEIDNFLYELPDVGMPTLELGDKLLNIFGTEGEDLFNDLPTKKDEEDTILPDIIDDIIFLGWKMLWTKLVKYQKIFFLWWR